MDQVIQLGQMAIGYINSGNFAAAEKILKGILKSRPKEFNALNLCGYVLVMQSRELEALEYFKKAYSQNSRDVGLLHNYGKTCIALEMHEQVIRLYSELMNIVGINEELLIEVGRAYFGISKFEDAIKAYDLTLTSFPQSKLAYINKTATLIEIGQASAALEIGAEALNMYPSDPFVLSNYGSALFDVGRYTEAASHFQNAIKINPHASIYWMNAGNALTKLREFDEGRIFYERAIEIDPFNYEAFYNLGVSFDKQKKHDEAIEAYKKAISLKQDYAQAIWNLAQSQMCLGDYQPAWVNAESRWFLKKSDQKRHQAIPPLIKVGEANRASVLVWHEQGLGDTIQFSRYLKPLKNLGYDITFEVQSSLFRLMEASINDARVIESSHSQLDEKSFDYQIPLMSLPSLFDIPITGNSYLKIPTNESNKFNHYINRFPKNQKRVGIVCSGNAMHVNDLNRSISLKLFKSLLGQIKPILLQKDIRREDLETAQEFELIKLGDDIDDFADTAALISQLDLVISVDTSVAHLCGAMGVPVWILLAYENDSRWLAEGGKTTWYDSAILLRQDTQGDWADLMIQLEHKLKKFLIN